MTRAAASSFYDKRLRSDLDDRYAPLWTAAAALVPDGASVVELGCGTGRFAALIAPRHWYAGIDFSAAAVAEARQHVPGADFRLVDLRSDPIPAADCYVALEVLEHLDDDVGLLARLPSAAMVILSVPSFGSAGHVRTFPRRGSAADRYDQRLLLTHLSYIDLPPTRRTPHPFFHLMAGRVR